MKKNWLTEKLFRVFYYYISSSCLYIMCEEINEEIFQCVVPKCQNSSNSPGITMHKFPNDTKMKSVWTAKIFHGIEKNIEAMHVCCHHFMRKDFETYVCGKKVLKNEAEPLFFLPESDTESELDVSFLSKKKRKLQKEIVANFNELPDLVVLEICSYLSFQDIYNVGRVCKRWYEISRTCWTKVDVKVESSLHMLKFLFTLPSNVKFLSISCDSFDRHHSLWLPDVMVKLNECCPGIESLIIENAFFSPRSCNANLTTHQVSQLLEAQEAGPSKRFKRSCQLMLQCRKECCNEKNNSDKYVPENRPQELRLFSLRYAHSFMSHLSSQISQFLPDVRVLDLTYSAIIKTTSIPFFLRLTYLEELYLTECPITNSAIESLLQHVKRLKVLDLEGCRGVNDETFAILLKHGNFLEKLYLGNTKVQSFAFPDDALTNLDTICIRNTLIRDEGISYFAVTVPKLKHIDASFCKLQLIEMTRLMASNYDREFVFRYEGDPKAICHHFKQKYM